MASPDLYVDIWKMAVELVVDAVVSDTSYTSYILKRELFEDAGNRPSGFGFSKTTFVDGKHTACPNSAVARDLVKAMESSSDFKSACKGKIIVLRMSNKFEFSIEVQGKSTTNTVSPMESKIEQERRTDVSEIDKEGMMDFIKKNFKPFYPLSSADDVLPARAGNYVFLLKEKVQLPIDKVCNQPAIRTIEIEGLAYQLIYTGIAGDNLRKRILKQHLYGNNAGRSTFRKSIGSLMGLKKMARDKVENSKTKFCETDEDKLTEWMQNNLVVLSFANENCEELENKMIAVLNPPLNLDKNKNTENRDFRKELSLLRRKRTL